MKNLRPAIAMIELIFALVIMAIILMSAPRLATQAQKSSLLGVQQEAINEASSHIMLIMSYPWDQNNIDLNLNSIPTILETNGSVELDENTTTGRRRGMPLESGRTFIRFDGNTSSTTTNLSVEDSVEDDDIDDFIGTHALTLKQSVTSGRSDNIEKNVTITTNIDYHTDAPTGGTYQANTIAFNFTALPTTTNTSSIKYISTNITSGTNSADTLNTNITLFAFSCNIGSYEFERR